MENPPPLPGRGVERPARLAFTIVAAVAAMAVFSPALRNDFVLGDDNVTILRNPHIQGFSADNVRWMLTTFRTGHWEPVGWIVYGALHGAFGFHPFGWHLAALILHGLNAALFFLLAEALYRAAAGRRGGDATRIAMAAMAASLFYSLHPLRTEVVAWASCMTYLLAALFAQAALLIHLQGAAGGRLSWKRNAVALLFFALSLLSIPIAMPLPLALVALDVYPLRRIGLKPTDWLRDPAQRRAWLEKAPYFPIFLAEAGLTIYGKAEQMADTSLGLPPPSLDHSFPAGMLYGLTAPLLRTLWPFQLSPHNRLPDILREGWAVGAGWAGLVLILSALVWRARRWPAVAVAAAVYIFLLLPMAARFGADVSADRYATLAGMPLSILAGAILFPPKAARRFNLIAILLLAIACALGAISRLQTHVWRDSTSLCRQMLKGDPVSWLVNDALGDLLIEEGDAEGALACYQTSFKNRPRAETLNSIGAALASLGRREDAAQMFHQALAMKPDFEKAKQNLRMMGLKE